MPIRLGPPSWVLYGQIENLMPSSRPSITQGCWRYRLPDGPHMMRRHSRFRPRITCPELFSSESIRRQYGTNLLRQPLAQIAEVSVGSEPSSLCVRAA